MPADNSNEEKGHIQSAWGDFTGFIYNSQTGAVMGRTGKSWAKILIFYVFYYGFCAGLFVGALSLILGTLDEYNPSYQTRVQAPGVTIQPKTPSLTEQTSDIIFNQNDPASYQKYINYLDTFLEPYSAANQTGSQFKNCGKDKPDIERTFTGNEEAKACRFDRSLLDECASGNYGYDKGQPCILIKVNRIINWYPIGYTDLSKAVGNEDSNAPALMDILKEHGRKYDPSLMYTVCYGSRDQDKLNLNGGVSRTATKYFPKDNGVGFQYFPYFGLKRQPKYLNPLVAAKFTNVTRNVDISVKCKAYAANIGDSARMGIGFFGFYLRINDN